MSGQCKCFRLGFYVLIMPILALLYVLSAGPVLHYSIGGRSFAAMYGIYGPVLNFDQTTPLGRLFWAYMRFWGVYPAGAFGRFSNGINSDAALDRRVPFPFLALFSFEGANCSLTLITVRRLSRSVISSEMLIPSFILQTSATFSETCHVDATGHVQLHRPRPETMAACTSNRGCMRPSGGMVEVVERVRFRDHGPGPPIISAAKIANCPLAVPLNLSHLPVWKEVDKSASRSDVSSRLSTGRLSHRKTMNGKV